MAPTPDDFDQTPSQAGSPHARDLGLRRSRRITRWIAVTAVAGAAALASFYTHLVPGGSAAPTPPSPPVQNPAASTATTAGDDDEEHGEGSSHEDDDEGAVPVAQPALQPPAQPPAASQGKPHTTTGAS
ncbi:hypothetical protein [Streptomyces sp. NBC_01794]|uniref:hypothetical protein n=1 Tax=Streptomyces sp. NBC_01794 TaxID=2975942 RepID=UPI003090F267|nr:hypothetical protein OIE54_21410 [Streptomyces sp. NBC_01794]